MSARDPLTGTWWCAGAPIWTGPDPDRTGPPLRVGPTYWAGTTGSGRVVVHGLAVATGYEEYQ